MCGMSAIGYAGLGLPLLIVVLAVEATADAVSKAGSGVASVAKGAASGAASGGKSAIKSGAGFFTAVQELAGQDAAVARLEKLQKEAIEKPNDLRTHLSCAAAYYIDCNYRAAYDHITRYMDLAEGRVEGVPAAVGIAPTKAARFLRGMICTALQDYATAIADFTRAADMPAVAGAAAAGGVSQCDVLNERGKAKLYSLLYPRQGAELIPNRLALLDSAAQDFDAAFNGANEGKDGYRFNRGLAMYFKHFEVKDDSAPLLLDQAMEDFNVEIADARSMLAQCYALKGNMPEAQKQIDKALHLNPKVFVADLTAPATLSTPWPLSYLSPHEAGAHNFTEVHFNTPTWCATCTKFLSSPIGKNGSICKVCGLKVHKDCAATAAKNCSGTAAATPLPHQMQAVHFDKPTFCDFCKAFVANPFGKQGFSCSVCSFKVHNSCMGKYASSCWRPGVASI